MSQEATPQKIEAVLSIEKEEKETKQVLSLEELVAILRTVQDDIGQIYELTSEEGSFVEAFFSSLRTLMNPLTPTLPVSKKILGEKERSAVQANIDPDGHLMVFFRDGRVILKNLKEKANRDLMIRVAKDVLPKFKQLTTTYRQKIEFRINFLSSVTKELQKISNAFEKVKSS
jgi:phosphatidylserine/phosphatidylglycerophosphate/cardiolipin synthase-like enzyme